MSKQEVIICHNLEEPETLMNEIINLEKQYNYYQKQTIRSTARI